MKTLIRKLLRKVGIQIRRYPDRDHRRRIKIINSKGINIVFDVGANIGQYAYTLRNIGYKNKIISFEPLSEAFEDLRKNSLHDNNWIVNNYALGNENMNSFINVSENSHSSSILNLLPKLIESDPNSIYIEREEVEIKKLDSIVHSFCKDGNENIMLKIDAQGFEKNVIDGATNTLPIIKIIQLEMPLVPLYENEMLFTEMIEYLVTKGFMLFSLENGFDVENTGQLLEIDGIFVKSF